MAWMDKPSSRSYEAAGGEETTPRPTGWRPRVGAFKVPDDMRPILTPAHVPATIHVMAEEAQRRQSATRGGEDHGAGS